MRIFVTKNILVLFVLLLVAGCTRGKIPPPIEPDDPSTYGGTTNQGYVEPMYPLNDAGIFLPDELPAPNNTANPKNNNSNNAGKNTKNNKKTSPEINSSSTKTTPTTDNSTIDNSIMLFDTEGHSELYTRMGKAESKGYGFELESLSGDLDDQVDEYILQISENLEDLKTSADYAADGDSINRDASGLAIVVLMIGLLEKDSRYRQSAPGLLVAVKRLIMAPDYKVAVKEFDAVKAALNSKGEPEKLKLEKVAKLKPVMKAMPNLNSTVRRLTNTETKLKRQLDKKPKRIFGQLAALAAISAGSIPNGDETSKPNELDKWRSECERFRDAAIKANAAAHDFANGKIKYERYWSTFSELSRSCDSCHKIFYPESKITNEE
ncbi:MAG: hypothetical protein LBC74_11300 [Planctomycetaceae bacterium]|jgi:hypothetical protein|nr:hypothetical protein [Planctomycetaceae bacterium]